MATPSRTGLRLDARPPEEVAIALGHPAQLAAQEIIVELIRLLRECQEDGDYEDYQRALFQQIYAAEGRRAMAKRNVRRAERGKRTPEAPTGSWDYELMVADRVCRQLRCVGDALAWRAFGFDRRPLIALASNELPGPMYDKIGLGHELGAAVEAWEQRGNFALLHDLTNTLRMGDLTEFTEEGPRVAEVKASHRSSSGGRASRQRRRLEAAIAAVNDGAPLAGDGTTLVKTSVPLRTRLNLLEPVLKRARREGLVVEALSEGVVVSVMSARGVEVIPSPREVMGSYDVLANQAMRSAHLEREAHLLSGYSVDSRDCHAATAPYSIFPFDPQICAELVTDRLRVTATVGWTELAAPFDRLGWTTHCPVPGGVSTVPSDVLVATNGDRTLTLHRDGVMQALIEFHDLGQLAAGMIEVASREDWRSGVLVFSDEHEVWR
jgi:hypothetical protein